MKWQSPFLKLREAGVSSGAVNQSRQEQERRETKRDLPRWLLLVPLILLLLFGCGTLGMIGLSEVHADKRSLICADFSPWAFSIIKPVNPEIIEEIQQDQNRYPGTFSDPARDTTVEHLLVLRRHTPVVPHDVHHVSQQQRRREDCCLFWIHAHFIVGFKPAAQSSSVDERLFLD